jgi:hypothetical protein
VNSNGLDFRDLNPVMGVVITLPNISVSNTVEGPTAFYLIGNHDCGKIAWS